MGKNQPQLHTADKVMSKGKTTTPDTEEDILRDSIYVKLKNRQN